MGERVEIDANTIYFSLVQVHRKLDKLLEKEGKLMRTSQEDMAEASEHTTLLASMQIAFDGVKASLQEKLAARGVAVPLEVQNAIDATFAALAANNATITAAIVANTPAAEVDPNATPADQVVITEPSTAPTPDSGLPPDSPPV